MVEDVRCFMYVKATILTENYKTVYELWRRGNQILKKTQRKIDVQQERYISRKKRSYRY
jgi:hypothetical protein